MIDKIRLQSKRPLSAWDVLKAILALVLLGYVASQTNFEQLLKLGERFSWTWFAITFFLFFSMIVLKAVQYYYLIDKRTSFLRVLEIVVLQNALMNFVATAAGIASYLTMLGAEKDVRFGRAAVSFIVVKMGDIMAVLVLLLASLFWVSPLPKVANRIVVLTLAFTVLIIIIFFAAILLRRKFVEIVKKMLSFFKLENVAIIQKGVDLLDAIAEQDQKKIIHSILTAFMLSILYIGLATLWAYARLRMFSLTIEFAIVAFVSAMLQIASWIPVYILGGLGVSETLSVYLFALFGENKIELAAVMIGVRIIFYLMNAISLLYLPAETIFRINRHENRP